MKQTIKAIHFESYVQNLRQMEPEEEKDNQFTYLII
jgi:hypothetical protein